MGCILDSMSTAKRLALTLGVYVVLVAVVLLAGFSGSVEGWLLAGATGIAILVGRFSHSWFNHETAH